MIRKIIENDRFLLSRIGVEATKDDMYIVTDLLDTFKQYDLICGGMAANMIGENKRIIIYKDEKDKVHEMANPVIVKTYGKPYETEEACLSLGKDIYRPTKRYHKIKAEYYDRFFNKRTKNFEALTAQIIQREIDHCNGIMI
ncbi:MAG: peptide deformylase [Erysipelotrichaceae bacterium]|nr:peptide deformylase [Erysipelotrichaceae bacterium]